MRRIYGSNRVDRQVRLPTVYSRCRSSARQPSGQCTTNRDPLQKMIMVRTLVIELRIVPYNAKSEGCEKPVLRDDGAWSNAAGRRGGLPTRWTPDAVSRRPAVQR